MPPRGRRRTITGARPERFELPTFWFVGAPNDERVCQINKLDGPPSPGFPPKLVE